MAKLAIYWWHSRKGSFEVISPWWEWQGGGRGTLGACANWQPCSCCWRRWDPPDSTLTHLFMPSHPQSLAPTTKPILFTDTITPNTPNTNLSHFKLFELSHTKGILPHILYTDLLGGFCWEKTKKLLQPKDFLKRIPLRWCELLGFKSEITFPSGFQPV